MFTTISAPPAPCSAGGNLLERLLVGRHEAGLQQQVLGRVAGDRQLREHGDVAARALGPLESGENGIDVAVEVAHDGVQLAGGDAEPSHAKSVPAPVRLPSWPDRRWRGRSKARPIPRRSRSPSTGSPTPTAAWPTAWPATSARSPPS